MQSLGNLNLMTWAMNLIQRVRCVWFKIVGSSDWFATRNHASSGLIVFIFLRCTKTSSQGCSLQTSGRCWPIGFKRLCLGHGLVLWYCYTATCGLSGSVRGMFHSLRLLPPHLRWVVALHPCPTAESRCFEVNKDL